MLIYRVPHRNNRRKNVHGPNPRVIGCNAISSLPSLRSLLGFLCFSDGCVGSKFAPLFISFVLDEGGFRDIWDVRSILNVL